jgi:tetratricopeptide (TPR) repeat protein
MRTILRASRRFPGATATLIASFVLCAATTAPPAAQSQKREGSSRPYGELIELYRRDEVAEAVTELARVDETGVRALGGSWFHDAGSGRRRADDVPPSELELAAMLHTDCAFALLANAPSAFVQQGVPRAGVSPRRISGEVPPHVRLADVHLELADHLLDAADTRSWESGTSQRPSPSFHARWYLAVAMFMHRSEVSFGDKWIDRGLARFPRDGGLLLEAGVGREQLAIFPPFRAFSLADRQGALQRARDYFERALEVHPGLAEARVRLARVRVDLEPEGALSAITELRAVADNGPGDDVSYLANLFLGDLQERAGDLAAAETRFRAAIALAPEAQAARTALAHLLYRTGDRQGAVAVSREALANDCAEIDCDPWWRYPRTQLRSFDELLLGLRTEARR